MRVRTLVGLAALAATIGVGGWNALGLAGWNAAEPADPADTVVALAVEPEEPQVPAAEPEPAPAADTVPGIFGWDPSLLNPQRLAGPKVAAAAESMPAPAPAAPPLPPVRAQEDAGPAPKHVEAKPPARAAKTKPKRDHFDGRLTVAQIAHIRERLRLSPDQEEYWKPVEAMLVDLVRKHARSGRLALNAVEMQNLYWAAGPLVMRLRDDQKHEARNLARAMGLETVASLI
jgi:hypothetical protein